MPTRPRIALPRLPFLFLVLLASAQARAQSGTDDDRFGIALEFGPVGFSRNDVRVPGTTGTEFDMTDLTGTGADFFARVSGHWDINEKHGIRLVVAPLEVSGTGELRQDTEFAGETFSAGATKGIYQFNAYKLTYRYTFRDGGDWRWRIGFTGLIRDANIELRQGALRANDDDVGFVPALHLSGEYRINDRWLFALDLDGLAGGPGRLFDVALKLEYDLTDRWRIGGGYRTLEGGADTDDVYTFAWLHYGVLNLSYRF